MSKQWMGAAGFLLAVAALAVLALGGCQGETADGYLQDLSEVVDDLEQEAGSYMPVGDELQVIISESGGEPDPELSASLREMADASEEYARALAAAQDQVESLRPPEEFEQFSVDYQKALSADRAWVETMEAAARALSQSSTLGVTEFEAIDSGFWEAIKAHSDVARSFAGSLERSGLSAPVGLIDAFILEGLWRSKDETDEGGLWVRPSSRILVFAPDVGVFGTYEFDGSEMRITFDASGDVTLWRLDLDAVELRLIQAAGEAQPSDADGDALVRW